MFNRFLNSSAREEDNAQTGFGTPVGERGMKLSGGEHGTQTLLEK